MKKQLEKYKSHNYGSESIDITLVCRNYLLENNFHENSASKNIELLEQVLVNYSVIKLSEWNPAYEKLAIKNWNDLNILINALNDQIPTYEEKKGFFAQYTLCILYIYASIMKQTNIEWNQSKDAQDLYTYITYNGILKKVITKESTPPHEIPIQLLEKIKSYNSKTKNPVLKK